MKQRILFVDDEPHILDSLRRNLRAKGDVWEMEFVGSANDALAKLKEADFDTVVTDVRMPGKTGFQLLEAILVDERTCDIPVIILTGEHDHDLKRKALEVGAADLLNKPVCAADLIARLCSVLRLHSYQKQVKAQNALLEARVQERTKELLISRQEIVWRLAKAGEYRDEETGNHVMRVSRYCQAIAEALDLDGDFTEKLTLTSSLHDIGKIAVPDSILRKPGKLTPEEWDIMKQHCAIGATILRENYVLPQASGAVHTGVLRLMTERGNPLLDMAAIIALHHHEKWNGSGYPQGLVGEAIPLEARIVALADVYDALSSARPYKPAFPETEVKAIMTEGVGQHFDPYAFSGLERSFEAMRAIRADFPDKEATNVTLILQKAA